MQFAILIHSNPQPWAHPTSDHTVEYAAQPRERQQELSERWDEVFSAAKSRGEIVAGYALGDPATARVYDDGVVDHNNRPAVSAGPAATTPGASRALAGIFVIDVDAPERAEEIASAFACPGDTVELRAMWVEN